MDRTPPKRLAPYLENVSEATAACLFAMVQGNLLTLTLSHWLVASQTGLIAGSVTSAILIAFRTHRPWVVSGLLGLVTTVADYWIHPGMFGPFFLEAVVTGLTAGVLSYAVQRLILWVRSSPEGV